MAHAFTPADELTWEEYEDRYRDEWERDNNGAWDDVSLGYRYGWESAYDPTYGSLEWEAAEGGLERGWEEYSADYEADAEFGDRLRRGWQDFRDSVRAGWERARREVAAHI